MHLRHIQPLPGDLAQILAGFRRIVVPELNSGQLAGLLRKEYLVDVIPHGCMQGRPFTVSELENELVHLGVEAE